MNRQQLDDYLLSFPNTWLDFPFGETVSVYKIGHKDMNEGKIFALVDDTSNPLRVSLKCDPQLAEHLRVQYESVTPGYHLNKKHWNTIICSGQLRNDEIFDLVRLSYDLVAGIRD